MKNRKKLITATSILSALVASAPAFAVDQGDILVRARIINIAPDVGSNQVMAGGAPLAPPAGIDVDSQTTLDIDFTYMTTKNIGIELLLDLSSTHDINGTGNLSGVKVGDVTVLPPALIAQWHFMPDNNIRPYAGAGIDYAMFFNESTTDQFTSTIDAVAGPGVTSTGLSVDDTFGLVAQVGVDIDINKDWFVNFDAKYIDMNTTATVQVNGADTATVDFDLNPWVLGVGVGTKF
jgi:outer membrane protein